MADQQRFEGASIEEVLAEVRTSLGPDAEIVQANKVRSGGIGGFFAKESYEVLAMPAASGHAGPVELPPGIDRDAFDRAAAHVLGTADGAPTSLMDLADRVSDVEQRATTDEGAGATPSTGPAAPAVEGHQPRSRAEAVAQQAMQDHLRRAASPHPAASATGTPPGGLAEGATPARRAAQDVAQVYHAVEADRGFQPLAADDLPHLSTQGSAFNDVLQRMAATAGPEATHALDERIAAAMAARRHADPDPAHQQPAHPAPAPRPAQTAAPTAAPAAMAPIEADMTPARRPEAATAADVEVHTDRTSRLLSWLERDNLPRTTLMTALRSLPQMPELPQATGIVVAVVGERKAALKMCRALAKACDADPADVVLASTTYSGTAMAESQRIIDVTDAARERLSWRRRPRPTFVAVECPTALHGDVHEWTRGIVDALEAHQVIGVVQASRKVEDVARWVELVGGVDGLALQGLVETSTPYAVLALEIPVAYLDEVVATAGTWAQALLEGAPA